MKECPSCKKPIEVKSDTCEYCGLVFSKWEAKNKPFDEKEVDKEIELARSEYHKAQDKKSFRFMGISLLVVIVAVLVFFILRPIVSGPEREAAIKFLEAVKALDTDKIYKILSEEGITGVERYGGITPESLSLICSLLPTEYSVADIGYEGKRCFVLLNGAKRWEGSTAKIFVSKEAGVVKVGGFECELIEDGLLVLPPYNQNQTISQVVMDKAVEQLKMPPLGEEYFKDPREKISRKVRKFYKRGRSLRAQKVFDNNDNVRVAFSGDGKYFIAASYGNYQVKIWKTSDWSLVKEVKTEYRISSVAALSDGSAFLLGDADGNIMLVPLTIESLGRLSMFNVNPGFSLRVAISGNSRFFGTVSPDKMLTLWTYPTRKNILKMNLPFELSGISFSPVAPYLAAATKKNTFIIWDLRNGVGGYFSIQKVDTASSISAIAFSPDGRYLLTCHSDSSIAVSDLLRFKEKYNFYVKNSPTLDGAFSFDGKVFATAQANSNVYLWDTDTGSKLDILKGHAGPVSSVAFSPAGDWLASAGEDKKVIIWSY